MTSTKTTTTKPNYYYAALVTLAMMAAMLVASGVALAATTTFGNSSPIQIVDGGQVAAPNKANPYPSQITVQNLSEPVSDVNVKLNGFIHDFPDDVDVLLVGPQGQKALLMSDTGGRSGLFPDNNSANLTFDDETMFSLPDDNQITTGTYKPTQGTITDAFGDHAAPASFPSPAPAGPYATNLSVFDGTNPNGTWDLYVIDDTEFDSGEFVGGWSLKISTGTSPQPDTRAPRVKSTDPLADATGVSPETPGTCPGCFVATATFSEEMQPSTINTNTFKLFKKGSTTNIVIGVGYDSTTHTAKLVTNALQRGATYKAVVTTAAKDRAGNRLDQNLTLAGLQPKVWFFKVQN